MAKLTFLEIEEAYERHVDSIYAFFAAKLLDKKAAEDLTSETFITFVRKAKQEEIDNIRAYIYGIARNLFLLHLRAKYALPSVQYRDSDDFTVYVESVVEKTQTLPLEERVRPYLDMLPEKQKLVISLRLLEKLTLSEIATKLGHDMNYVKTTQKRAINKLRELIACTPEPTSSV